MVITVVLYLVTTYISGSYDYFRSLEDEIAIVKFSGITVKTSSSGPGQVALVLCGRRGILDSPECMEAAMKFLGGRRSRIGRICSWSALSEDGQALVEFSLVASVMLIAITGILIFGIFEMQIMALTEGVNSAGRVLAVSSGLTLDPCNTAASAIQSAAPMLNASNLSYQIVLNPTPSLGATSNHSYTGSTCSSTSTATGAHGIFSFHRVCHGDGNLCELQSQVLR